MNHYLVLEYCPNSDLWHFLISKTCLTEAHAATIIAQLLCAFQFLHSLDIARRDIKSESILLDDHFDDKLSDVDRLARRSRNLK
jgi:serine/threonine protein kinase